MAARYAPSNQATQLISKGNRGQGRITAKGAFHFLCAVPHKKWNPIEHRLFSEISRNWSGCPLESFDLILNYIASTTTRTGLVVTSRLNRTEYPTGIQISDEQIGALNLTPNEHIPKWNYTISPCLN